jgi:serine/threonine protein kinase
VLVSSEGLSCVKLGDVGLSRTLSSSPYYVKSSNDKVPVRWMAPESVVNRKYSVASDVWSFGVLCWEVYADAQKPYAVCYAIALLALLHSHLPAQGLTNEGVVNAVFNGVRLERPACCPENVYVAMLGCWQLLAADRPAWPAIMSALGNE